METDFSSTALVINSEGMGQGDEVLRQKLLTNYLRTLVELETPPQTILFYTSGVFMATLTSPCRGELDRLTKLGSRIIACRTCLDHYNLMEKIPADEIGNMLAIVEAQSIANRVITL